ncbi:TPA: 1-(5-phosphoribosyl)-5-[(5-phosphoribosylamino)methylideneamino]imidazole-4-carboxamide isomerase [Methanocaldococcus jannaschii]|uniref:1-(5-phosphoribosyl)-5-[(5-phosphoribosylamino)methylideneamino] imidazole-4-carboxamide isomerase n=2 Tax=Methanocaldococcus jannaschii TaxID=2190 RepID=HIS4_METJA|nr:1-(5-phosphoribosyl)-5-[(5-phosphoribosylamino)methylideneamino]imidazole-4-carboxamide isomerase [Methanocaldococcus jannaschii]Q58927.1 RecName: Full=1-(5-phosphoribosyl)-5-[(5-phosphoribosylamino)methylideneamino] imidazole-4-carboxamide isomerase; AltName: Full=Phosphoribosylformimino-5-aminoimidazole carboxamide ribotide isomerase [Methanocaldococcus jannaschii DSM 2661]AAB99553.1 phosphoribosylformimino-5-aminoimidazole carboxamide ribotide isomerase (hisA1) [Methanocaldococcus jannaschi
MIIIPAVDLKDKKCVQLIQGDPNKKHLELNNPVEVAKKFVDEGAEYLHIIDLDAAFGTGNNRDVIKNIIKEVNVPVEVGGGIRNLEIAKELISLGVDRVIVGTKAILEPKFIDDLNKEIGKDKIVLAVECKEGKVVIKGWKEKVDKTPIEVIKEFEDKVGYILFTNVDVEGLLKGINVDIIKELIEKTDIPIIYSGGITTLEDIKALKELGIYGVVIGSALYKGLIDLKKALEIVKN